MCRESPPRRPMRLPAARPLRDFAAVDKQVSCVAGGFDRGIVRLSVPGREGDSHSTASVDRPVRVRRDAGPHVTRRPLRQHESGPDGHGDRHDFGPFAVFGQRFRSGNPLNDESEIQVSPARQSTSRTGGRTSSRMPNPSGWTMSVAPSRTQRFPTNDQPALRSLSSILFGVFVSGRILNRYDCGHAPKSSSILCTLPMVFQSDGQKS